MQVRFAMTRDLDLILPAVCHPLVYARTCDDGSPPREAFQPPETCLYAAVWCGDDFGGVFVLQPHNSIMIEVHTALLPTMWGNAALIGKAFIAWVFATTVFRRMITAVPVSNRLALKLATASGMTEYGRNPDSFLKNGQLHTQIMLGVSKEH